MAEAKSKLFAFSVCLLMVVTGSLNTICAKWADRFKVDGVEFNHPFLQAACMFVGEFLCMGAYFVVFAIRTYKWRKENGDPKDEPRLPRFNPFLFLPPAFCDIVGTSVMYIGLNLTTASSYQMLRGALIVCTGLLSIVLVRARIEGYRWMGMFSVVLGLVVVGVTDILCGDDEESSKGSPLIGDVLCVVAQVVVALQMVLEQKYINKHDVEPLFAVGLEGIYGLVILCVMMVPLYYIHVPSTISSNPYGRLEDLQYAWEEICDKPMIAVALAGTTLSIAFFNFAGVTVTKTLSATTRTVVDSIRTLVIWVVGIPLFDQKFIPWQIFGFALLILGMFIYNDIVLGPWFRQNVLFNMDESKCCTRCCFTFCGIDRTKDVEAVEKAEKAGAVERSETDSDSGFHL